MAVLSTFAAFLCFPFAFRFEMKMLGNVIKILSDTFFFGQILSSVWHSRKFLSIVISRRLPSATLCFDTKSASYKSPKAGSEPSTGLAFLGRCIQGKTQILATPTTRPLEKCKFPFLVSRCH